MDKSLNGKNEKVISISVFFACIAIVVITAFPFVTTDLISYDSSYQYFLTQHSLKEIWELIPQDYSPPLYSLLLKAYCSIFGYSLVTMRSMSLFAVVGMLAVSSFVLKRVLGTKVSAISSLLICCMPLLTTVYGEIRPTVFGTLFSFCAAVYAFLSCVEDRKSNYVLFTAFTVLCMYTHNIAMLCCIGYYAAAILYCLFKKSYKKVFKLFICGIVSSIAYAPWLTVVFKQFSNVKDHFWTTNIDLSSYVYLTAKTVGLHIFLLCVFVALIKLLQLGRESKNSTSNQSPVALYLKSVSKTNKFAYILIWASMFVIISIIVLLFHNLAYPLLSERYMYMITPLLIVPTAILLSSLKGKIMKAACISLTVVICAISYSEEFGRFSKSTPPETMVSEVSSVFGEEGDVAFLHLHEHTLGTLSYYFPNSKHYVCSDTFTVLNTYDVFTTNVIQLNDADEIFDYETKFVICDNYYFYQEFTASQALKNYSTVQYDIKPIKEYRTPYFYSYNMKEVTVTE